MVEKPGIKALLGKSLEGTDVGKEVSNLAEKPGTRAAPLAEKPGIEAD